MSLRVFDEKIKSFNPILSPFPHLFSLIQSAHPSQQPQSKSSSFSQWSISIFITHLPLFNSNIQQPSQVISELRLNQQKDPANKSKRAKNFIDYAMYQSTCIIISIILFFMEPIPYSLGFGLLSQEQIARLDSKKSLISCRFLFSFQQDNPTGKTYQEDNKISVELHIIEDFVVQKNLDSEIVEGFECIYENQFEIIRAHSNNQKILGEPLQIMFFVGEGENSKEIKLLLADETSKLEEFAKILSRKFIVRRGFRQAFRPIVRLGKGMTAIVYKAESLLEHQEVAIKTFKRAVYFQNHGKDSFKKEFEILTKLKHKNLCQLIGVYQTQNSTYIVMELLKCSLFTFIKEIGFPTQKKIKEIMINLLEGIREVHALGIMHRDLKLQNIMMRQQGDKIEAVIVDFGLAEYTSNQSFLYTRCGTPGYVAPQILSIKSNEKKTYSEVCDIFSLGVIFFILLFKNPVFSGKQLKDVIKNNTECNINFEFQAFKNLPEGCQHLLKSMLEKDPNMRISAKQALAHPYLAIPQKEERQSKTISSIDVQV